MDRSLSRRSPTFLCVALIAGCIGPPVRTEPPASSAAASPVQRAERCLATLRTQPEDHGAQACYRQAMARLDRATEAATQLRVWRERTPDRVLAWYFEGRAQLGTEPEGAARTFSACLQRVPGEPWCLLGDALVRFRQNDPAGALERVREARRASPAAELTATAAQLQSALGRPSAALALAHEAVAQDERSPEAHLALANALLDLRRAEEASAPIARALALAPDSPEPYRLRARLHEARGDYEGAVADLRAAVTIDRHDDRVRAALGELLLESGEPQEALGHFNTLVDRDARHPAYLVGLGRALLDTGAPERALGWADLALTERPDDHEALTLRARALIRNARVEEALALRPQLYADRATAPERRVAIAVELARAGLNGPAESEFAEAVAAHPDVAEPWRVYAVWCARRDLLGRAATLLQRGIDAVPDSAPLHAELSDVHEQRGDLPAALGEMTAATRLAPGNVAYEDELARLEFMTGRFDAGLVRWERLVERVPHARRALVRLGHAYRAMGRLDEAVAAGRKLLQLRPGDADNHAFLGETLLMAHAPAAALEPLRQALALGADPQRVRPLLAAALADTGRTGEADAMFTTALDKDPGNRALRITYAYFKESQDDRAAALELYRQQLARNPDDAEVLERVVHLLGDRAARFVAEARTRVGLDDDLRALAAAAPEPSEGQLGTVLRDERYVTVDERGVARVRHVRSILVQRPEGAERYGAVSVSFHAQRAPEVVRARTITPDGEELAVPEADQRTRNPHAGTQLFGDARHLDLHFPRVEPGAILDYEVVTHRPHPELGAIWWDGYILGNVDPTVRVVYSVDLPADAEMVWEAPGLPPPAEHREGDRRRLVWTGRDLPPFRFVEDAAASLPAVYVTNLKSWRDVDQWYHSLFAPQSAVTTELAAHTRKLVAGLSTDRERIAAIYRDVERNVRYLGIEFGIGAYQPRPAATTLLQKQGDCKDMTALMVAMLSVIGIEAHPALVRPRDQGIFIEAHPSPGQFSHVLLYVPRKEGDLWLDATAGLGTLDAVPDILRGRHALVVDGKGGRLVEIPGADPRRHQLVEQLTYMLTMTGGGRIVAALELSGDLAGGARRRLLEVDAASLDTLLASPGYLVGRGRSARSARVDGLHEPARALGLRAEVTDPDLVGLNGDGTLLLPTDMAFFTEGPLPALGDGIQVGAARTFIRSVRIQPPANYRFEWEPVKYARRIGAVELHIEERRGAAQTEIETRLTLYSPLTARADQEALVRLLDHARTALGETLAIAPGPDFDAVAFHEALVRERPKDGQMRMLLGRALLQAGRAEEAIAALEQARRLAPDEERIHALLAAAAIRLDDPARAVAPLRALLERPNASPALFLTLAAVLTELSRPAEAAEVLRQGRSRHPGDAELARRLVLVLLAAGDRAGALAEAEALVATTPRDRNALALLGDVAARAGQEDKAERAYRKALEAAPDDVELLNNLAWLLRDRAGRLNEALTLVARALEIDPSRHDAWDTLAELRFRNGQNEAAVAALDRAEALDPSQAAHYANRRRQYLQPREVP